MVALATWDQTLHLLSLPSLTAVRQEAVGGDIIPRRCVYAVLCVHVCVCAHTCMYGHVYVRERGRWGGCEALANNGGHQQTPQ